MNNANRHIPPILLQKGYTDIVCMSAKADSDISIVYRVNRPGVGNWVVKRIKKEYATLYQAEKSILTTFSHDFLPIVFDVFEDDQALYIAMEFIHGVSLQQLIESTKLVTETSARKYFLQLCELFEYLHNKGVIHKDCKPSNIMLSNHGNVYLIDFGISKTPEHNPMGRTQMYASPEQLTSPDVSDPRIDIYSLGATMFSLLTKEPPIGNIEKLKNRTDVSKKFKRIITKCLAKKPDNRFQSIADLKKALVRKDWMWKIAAYLCAMLLCTAVIFFGISTWNHEVTERLLPRGYEMMTVSNYQVAIGHYERYIRRNPGVPDGYTRRRALLLHRGQYIESLDLFNNYEEMYFGYFIDNSPEFRDVWVDAIGKAMQYYYDQEMWDELLALLSCRRVQLVTAEYFSLFTHLQVKIRTGALEQALPYYRQLRELGETVEPSVYELILSGYLQDAHLYYSNNDFAAAIDMINVALQQYPNFSQNFDLLYLKAAAMFQQFFRERLLGREYESCRDRFIEYASTALEVAGADNAERANRLRDALNAIYLYEPISQE